MIDDIKVVLGVSSLKKSIELNIDYANNTANLNGITIPLDTHVFYRKLVRIISSWDKNMVNKRTLDGISYFVHITKDGKKYNYDGKNYFPKNFGVFMEFLEENNIW